jgi:hypothetical protein
MAQRKLNVLGLKAKGTASVSEKEDRLLLTADDAVAALQAIARKTRIRIDLSPGEVEYLVAAGKLNISLEFENDLAGATGAVKQIDRLAAAAVSAQKQKAARSRAGWRRAAWLILLAALAAFGFAVTVSLLDRVYGTRVLPSMITR